MWYLSTLLIPSTPVTCFGFPSKLSHLLRHLDNERRLQRFDFSFLRVVKMSFSHDSSHARQFTPLKHFPVPSHAISFILSQYQYHLLLAVASTFSFRQWIGHLGTCSVLIADPSHRVARFKLLGERCCNVMQLSWLLSLPYVLFFPSSLPIASFIHSPVSTYNLNAFPDASGKGACT